ncbi:polymorphic outer membrane protein [Planoprotostelium fungivorum]|uniref:Small ribosomal subunit protein mS29 n=1 Tax=Planoprotostelium fungivorum TaxID=1890364 RepID=A0A2P6NH50_9EUKA|nr:polymorphic outer membrane protein [Planoprotostelium fungivorum]
MASLLTSRAGMICGRFKGFHAATLSVRNNVRPPSSLRPFHSRPPVLSDKSNKILSNSSSAQALSDLLRGDDTEEQLYEVEEGEGMFNYPDIPDDLYITSQITGEMGEDGSYETGFDKYWYDFKPIIKIAETCPTDIGTKMIKLAKEDMKKKLPEGLPGIVKKASDDYFKGEPLLYQRTVVNKVIDKIDAAHREGFPNNSSILMDGPVGAGKSCALLSTVLWARQNGWIVIYIPEVIKLLHGGNYIEDSKFSPGSFDQPELSAELAKQVLTAHKEQLSKLELKTTPQLEGFKGKTLENLLTFAASPNNILEAGAAMYHFRRELNLVTEYPVLIALDGINSLYEPSIFADKNKMRQISFQRLRASGLTLAQTFLDWEKPNLVNGTVVAVTTRHRDVRVFSKKFPEMMEGATQITNMSPAETEIMIDLLTQNQWYKREVPITNKKYAYMISCGHPYDLIQYTSQPVSSEKKLKWREKETFRGSSVFIWARSICGRMKNIEAPTALFLLLISSVLSAGPCSISTSASEGSLAQAWRSVSNSCNGNQAVITINRNTTLEGNIAANGRTSVYNLTVIIQDNCTVSRSAFTWSNFTELTFSGGSILEGGLIFTSVTNINFNHINLSSTFITASSRKSNSCTIRFLSSTLTQNSSVTLSSCRSLFNRTIISDNHHSIVKSDDDIHVYNSTTQNNSMAAFQTTGNFSTLNSRYINSPGAITAAFAHADSSDFFHNWASVPGGSIRANTIYTSSCSFYNGTATQGGFVYSRGSFFDSNSTFRRGRATSGGAVFLENSPATKGSMSLRRSTFSDNTAEAGGALSVDIRGSDDVIITRSQFLSNRAMRGGGLYVNVPQRKLDLYSTRFANNSATLSGGGVYFIFGNATFFNSTFHNNSAGFLGGGIYSNETNNLRIFGCIFSENSCSRSEGASYWLNGTVTSENNHYNPCPSTMPSDTCIVVCKESKNQLCAKCDYGPVSLTQTGLSTYIQDMITTYQGNLDAIYNCFSFDLLRISQLTPYADNCHLYIQAMRFTGQVDLFSFCFGDSTSVVYSVLGGNNDLNLTATSPQLKKIMSVISSEANDLTYPSDVDIFFGEINLVVQNLLRTNNSISVGGKYITITAKRQTVTSTSDPSIALSYTSTESIINSSVPTSIFLSQLSTGNVDTTVLMINLPNNPFYSVTYSDVVGLSVYQNGRLFLASTTLQDPYLIAMSGVSAPPAGQELYCMWWWENNQSWSSQGCDLRRSGGQYTCACTHLTNFTLGARDLLPNSNSGGNTIKSTDASTSTTPDNTSIILALVLPLIVLVFLVIVIFLFLFFGREKRLREERYQGRMNEMRELRGDFDEISHLAAELFIPWDTLTSPQELRTDDRCQVLEFSWKERKVTAKHHLIEDDRRREEHLKGIHHHNIVKFLGKSEDSGKSYVILEWGGVGSLEQFFENGGKMSGLTQMMGICVDVSSAMCYLEKCGIVHNNLSIANVMVHSFELEPSEQFVVKLSDFSSSTRAGHRSEETIQCRAPEILRGQTIISYTSDVWSFGLFLWELQHGRLLQVGGSSASEIRNGLEWAQDIYTGIALECLTVEPNGRPSFISVEHRLRSMYVKTYEVE